MLLPQRQEMEKRCTKCGEVKPLEDFCRDSTKKDGRKSECLACHAERERQRRADPEYRERTNARRRGRRATDPEYRERVNNQVRERYASLSPEQRELQQEQCRAYYQEHRAAWLEYRRRWDKHNPEKVKEAARRKQQIHPEWGREATRRYRARKRAATGEFSESEFAELCESVGSKCLCCGRAVFLEADHVIPLSSGGRNDISNIQPLCRSCNAKKATQATDYRLDPWWGCYT